MDILYARDAKKSLAKMPVKKAQLILTGMEKVAENPFAPDNTIKVLQGVPNGFRKRFGDYRVLYTVDVTVQILEVFKIGSRGDVYK